MDDCVEFAKRLKDVGVPVTLDVLSNIPHGYLNFGKVCQVLSSFSMIVTNNEGCSFLFL
jgi:acetyl esterase/lipase